MPTFNSMDLELDPAAVFAEHDRIMAEAAHDALAQAHNRATRNPDGLIYRTGERTMRQRGGLWARVKWRGQL